RYHESGIGRLRGLGIRFTAGSRYHHSGEKDSVFEWLADRHKLKPASFDAECASKLSKCFPFARIISAPLGRYLKNYTTAEVVTNAGCKTSTRPTNQQFTRSRPAIEECLVSLGRSCRSSSCAKRVSNRSRSPLSGRLVESTRP